MVDNFALVIRHIVVLKQILANVEVMRLHLALCPLDLAAQQAALNGLALAHASARQQSLGALRITKDAHERIFHRQIEAAGSGVTLAAGATP